MNENGKKYIKVAATDIDGVLRGKYINKDKFDSSLKGGIGFCDVIFGWDSDDYLYDKDSITGWRDGYPDAKATIDPNSKRELSIENNTTLYLMDFENDKKISKVCPRTLLKRVINLAKNYDIYFQASAEFEFFLFNETPNSIREKNYKNLENFTPGMFGYSMIRNSTENEFYTELLDMCEKMDMPLEGIHTETGPGVIEAALVYNELLKAADNATLFKTYTKVFSQKKGLLATFMAKWSQNFPGQSGHLHISAKNKKGDAIFYDKNKEFNISDTMRWFIGGQQKLLPEFLSLVAPTCNSYTRLIPGFWAPTQATWGIDNRTCAIRAIPGSEKSQRVEYRVSAADINPYIALSAAVASGLWGIINKIEPTEPIKANAYDVELPGEFSFSHTLFDSVNRLKNSKIAREIFGDAFVDHYFIVKEHEALQERKAISDWQLKRYFEII